MTRVLTRRQALSCMDARAGHQLDPRMLADGRQGVADGVNALAAYADIASVLNAGSVETVSAWSTETVPTILVDSKKMTMNNARRSYSISEPADNVFRQEMRANDPGTKTDLGFGNRRCEIVSIPEDGWKDGETLWMSFAVIVGSQHDGMSATDDPSNFGFVMQVHPINTTRPLAPCVGVDYSRGQARIFTASDAEVSEDVAGYGVLKTRWSSTLPATGVVTRFVMAVTFGQSGRLKAWVNGTVVFDADVPIGYWTNNAATGDVMGYPQWGIYEKNKNTTEVIYHANIEWGSTSLDARATTPLAVPDLSPWS